MPVATARVTGAPAVTVDGGMAQAAGGRLDLGCDEQVFRQFKVLVFGAFVEDFFDFVRLDHQTCPRSNLRSR